MYAEIPKSAGASATWTAPAVEEEVTYRVEASLPASSTSTKNATYVVSSIDGDTVIPVDQVAGSGTWVDLGEFTFDAAHRPTIRLTGADGFLRASALRFTDMSVSGLPSAPAPGFAAQEIAPDDAITGEGTAAGNAVVVTAADGTVLAEGTVADDLQWDAVGSGPFATGVYTDAVVTETDADGWIGTATATVTVAAPAVGIDLVGSVSSRCVGKKAQLTVTAKNAEDTAVDVTLSTPFGDKSFHRLGAGKSAFHPFMTGKGGTPAGVVTVTATAVIDGVPTSSVVTVPFAARSCG
jgi:hypothetical protein